MKTYAKRYEVIDIKGVLDKDDDDNYFITYQNDNKEDVSVDVKEVVDSMCGNYVHFKTITE